MHPSAPDTAAPVDPAPVQALSPRTQLSVTAASFVLVAALCAVALLKGLLPGLIAVCIGVLLGQALLRIPLPRGKRFPGALAATIVIVAPVGLLALAAKLAKGATLTALNQYPQLLNHMASTVLQIRQKLPESLGKHVPEGADALQAWLAQHLQAQSSALASLGQAWLHAGLLVYVGLVVGGLIAVGQRAPLPKPLAGALRTRSERFLLAFRQVVVAQVWIAGFNASMTAVLLFVLLPLFSVQVPYATLLVALTFGLGLVPIVGNLMCNVILSMVGVSVSPAVGVVCLVFLIAIHKTEYFINAMVVGRRTKTAAWELLAVLFAGEALFGIPGLVAAPLYYAYLKTELQHHGLV